MKSLPISIALLLMAAGLRSEIIDRIAVSVGNQAITTSDIEREIRLTAFLNRTAPDLTPANRRTTADRMVDQRLILRELESNRYPGPSPAEIEPVLEKFIKDNFASDADYRQALEKDGITEENVRDQLLWQRRLLMFIDVRFRPAVQVSAEDIEKYFNEVVAPAARAAHPGETPELENYHDQIDEKLTGDQEDRQLTAWLQGTRERAEVVFHPEAFQ